MVLLSGVPWRRGAKKGKCERLMIGEKDKFTASRRKWKWRTEEKESSLLKAEYLDSVEDSFLEKKRGETKNHGGVVEGQHQHESQMNQQPGK